MTDSTGSPRFAPGSPRAKSGKLAERGSTLLAADPPLRGPRRGELATAPETPPDHVAQPTTSPRHMGELKPPPTGLPDGHPRPTFTNLTLVGWLTSVRARGYRLELVDEGVVVLAPGEDTTGCHPVWRDYVAVKRWQHALQVAVARTHPDWWAYASGKTDQVPELTAIPRTDAPDIDAFACAACGGPADTIDQHALAHCAGHHPSTGWPA